MTVLDADFPEKLGFLFEPARYKIAKGGRWSGKSWGFARALLLIGVSRKIRVLCGREIQNSIKDSVHKLLSDQIQLLGLQSHYRVLDQSIRGVNGTEFMFTGLWGNSIDSLKSYESIDYCWIEEGQTISERSWEILTPTIRKEGSEIWVSMNPDLDTDPTYKRFVLNPPPDCVVVTMNWSDNPWFNTVGEQERLHCLKTNPDGYQNIWEGKCRPAVEGAIYAKEIESAQAENRICNLPYDPTLKAHVVVDLGWNDSMSIAIVQRHLSEIRIIDYIEDSHRTLDSYSEELKSKRLNWGKMWLPHDGFSGDIKTGKSVAQFMEKFGWNVPTRAEITELPLEGGIKLARMTFNRCYFEKTKTERLVECLKRYRRTVSTKTLESGSPMHDEFSHGADCFRYICLNADKMTNESTDDYFTIIPGQGTQQMSSGWAR